jgi:hypothetical protein
MYGLGNHQRGTDLIYKIVFHVHRMDTDIKPADSMLNSHLGS